MSRLLKLASPADTPREEMINLLHYTYSYPVYTSKLLEYFTLCCLRLRFTEWYDLIKDHYTSYLS
jgi:hypothetical protein